MNYKCCKLKPFVHYVCTICCSVFHRSCIQQHLKKKVKFIKDNKIICCQEDSFTSDSVNETSLLEKTISDLEEDGALKDKFIQKLKKDKQLALQQALESETEMNYLLDKQKKLVEEMECEINKLKAELAEKVISAKTIGTQTYLYHVNHQSTMTDPTCFSSVDSDKLGDLQYENYEDNIIEVNEGDQYGSQNNSIRGDITLFEEIEESIQQDDMRNLDSSSAKVTFSSLNSRIQSLNMKENEASKFLVIGDQYASGFPSVFYKMMNQPDINVMDIIKPGVEISDLTKKLFEYTLSFGQNDYVIVMFNTKSISNGKTLNLALKNILNLSTHSFVTNSSFLTRKIYSKISFFNKNDEL